MVVKMTFETPSNPYGTEIELEIKVEESRVAQGTLDRLEEVYLKARRQLEAMIGEQ